MPKVRAEKPLKIYFILLDVSFLYFFVVFIGSLFYDFYLYIIKK